MRFNPVTQRLTGVTDLDPRIISVWEDSADFGLDAPSPAPTNKPSPKHRSWLKKVIRDVGLPLTEPVHLLSKGANAVENEAKKIPVVGGLFAGIADITLGGPWHFADDVFHGVRIDKAVSRELDRQVRDFKEVGPYAQMVFSLVPGFGTAVAAALGAGVALANGQPITSALVAGLKGAVPGGPLAAMAFDMGEKALSIATKPGGFKNFENISSLADLGIAGLPIDASSQKALDGGVRLIANLASGKKILPSLLHDAVSSLPPEVTGPLSGAISDATSAIDAASAIDASALAPILSYAKNASKSDALTTLAAAAKRVGRGYSVDSAIVDKAVADLPRPLPDDVEGAISHLRSVAATMTRQDRGAAKIADAAISHVRSSLPALGSPLDALKSAMAVGHAEGIQIATAKQAGLSRSAIHGMAISPVQSSPLQSMYAVKGAALIKADPVAHAALDMAGPSSAHGLVIGAGAMHTAAPGPALVVRESLSGPNRKGFDLAAALHRGRILALVPAQFNPKFSAGYSIGWGLVGADPEAQDALLAIVDADPDAAAGLHLAAEHIAKEGREEIGGFWPHVWNSIAHAVKIFFEWL